MIVLGLDPSLTCTGWGVVKSEGARLTHVANGQIASSPREEIADRLAALYAAVTEVIVRYRPDVAAAEEVFLNKNPQSTLKLAHARGAVLAACGAARLGVHEHSAKVVKKSVVGTGGADKKQVQAMLKVLLPGAKVAGADAADALAVAIAHAHLGPRH
ncbi:crossover junction endodeoxyribonuclease RuvC [Croceicoccus mobilis]|uniref:Crossover junction endodeoxyribonuclease RuvC n=1 Tax=Croceicoccus mobilis TaxID=1703339 RepID=A0A917DPL3_9SPHN|nr:crossover junction endodeoxyribonuclease RuvC [Croceicoccus mobilis]GGD58849.1 crossover junction endodeoxyribonuclease RuvC [Croceicoccus mobilis]